jgi:hypothetical protein
VPLAHQTCPKPYTEEEEFDFYRRMNAGPMTIYRSRPEAAGKQASTQEPPQEGAQTPDPKQP